jgi:hypothetical protein
MSNEKAKALIKKYLEGTATAPPPAVIPRPATTANHTLTTKERRVTVAA